MVETGMHVPPDQANPLTYFGWSTIRIESEIAGELLFDPFFNSRYGTHWSEISDFDNTSVICVTHGHWEHYSDVPKIALRTGATIVASQCLCDHLAKRHKIPKGQLRAIGAGETLHVRGFEIHEFRWHHRDINYFKFFGGKFFTGIDFVFRNLLHTPRNTPMSGFVVKTPEGVTFLNLAEGMNGLLTTEELEALGHRYSPDVLLGGWQLNYVDAVADCVRGIGAKTFVMYHPHTRLFDLMSMASSPIEDFRDKIRETSPAVTVLAPNPRETVACPA